MIKYSIYILLLGMTCTTQAQNHSRVLGNKSYEVSNHLGNVMAVVSDRKLATPDTTNTVVDYAETDMVAYSDYYPYGMLMDARNDDDDYRFGFQGQEVDDEMKGDGNAVNYKYRMHDVRLGRFFVVDPLSTNYPHNSSYAFSENRIIDAIELEGLEKYIIHYYYSGSLAVKLKVSLYSAKGSKKHAY